MVSTQSVLFSCSVMSDCDPNLQQGSREEVEDETGVLPNLGLPGPTGSPEVLS